MNFVRMVFFLPSLAFLTGCSYIFARGPSRVKSPSDPNVTVLRHDELGEVDCTSGKGLPIADVIVGAVTLIGTAQGRVYYTTDDGQKSGPLPGIIMGGVFLSSAAYGFVVTSRCQDAKKYWAAHKNEEMERMRDEDR